jgi:hypothetical protein
MRKRQVAERFCTNARASVFCACLMGIAGFSSGYGAALVPDDAAGMESPHKFFFRRNVPNLGQSWECVFLCSIENRKLYAIAEKCGNDCQIKIELPSV